MNFLLLQLLKALVRVEKKLDEVLKLSLKASRGDGPGNLPAMPVPFGASGVCPLCQKPVSYRPVDLRVSPPTRVIIRECGCEPVPTELPSGGLES